jgi:hypothetical protein
MGVGGVIVSLIATKAAGRAALSTIAQQVVRYPSLRALKSLRGPARAEQALPRDQARPGRAADRLQADRLLVAPDRELQDHQFDERLTALEQRFAQQGVMSCCARTARAGATMTTSASDRRPAAAELRMLAGRYLYFGELVLGLERRRTAARRRRSRLAT